MEKIKIEKKCIMIVCYKMVYRGELTTGEVFDLDERFVENSAVIKGMIEVCKVEDTIPLMYEGLNLDILNKIVKILRFCLGDVDRGVKKFMGEYMVNENIEEIGQILNVVHFYDIGLVEDYLVEYFAERIKLCKNKEELEGLFGKSG